MPGIPYPYPELTVFNGRGGMESPMMVNDGSSGSRAGTVGVTSHEIAHTYFPFYMGTNERKYAWMDEGWAVMLPFEFQSRSVEGNDPLKRNVMTYSAVAGREIEMPLMVLSVFLQGNSYRIASYSRSGVAYYMLRQTLGDELFKKALHTYMKRWAGKHPLPYDFFFSFNDATGEDLSWFWKPWFYEFGYPDLAINNVKVDGDVVTVTVIKKGIIPVPVSVSAFANDEDKPEAVISETASVWADGKTSVTLKLKTKKPITKIVLGDDYIPDSDKSNNEYIIEQAN
jgi:aminopeptidase N